jgi:pyrroloquinoline quinone biosynthesis protein E
MTFENVENRSLRRIWEESDAFQKFRGVDWMPDLCRTCDRREQDFGGCRCQAFLLAHDASATDPICSLSPQRGIVDAILRDVNAAAPGAIAPETTARGAATPPAEWLYRPNPA